MRKLVEQVLGAKMSGVWEEVPQKRCLLRVTDTAEQFQEQRVGREPCAEAQTEKVPRRARSGDGERQDDLRTAVFALLLA